jgi:putative exporter of polyketide antibiotics
MTCSADETLGTERHKDGLLAERARGVGYVQQRPAFSHFATVITTRSFQTYLGLGKPQLILWNLTVTRGSVYVIVIFRALHDKLGTQKLVHENLQNLDTFQAIPQDRKHEFPR